MSRNAAPAAGRGPSKTVLAQDVIMLAKGHFPEISQTLLTSSAKSMGAIITDKPDEATVVLVNPCSAAAKETAAAHASAREAFPDRRHPDHVTYNWIAACWYANARVPFSEVRTPFLVHPDVERDHHPLATWVSVNVNRADGEKDQHETRTNVAKMLELEGALLVQKRSCADLLVVDKQTSFYGVVKAEKEKNGRDWQRVVERDWADDCVKKRKMRWPEADVEEVESDSTEEEEEELLPRQSKPVGRPVGKPRVEYTPEDDDFLCRYLAAYHPEGSWLSRKTYYTLVDRADKFPVIHRHTAQSWHERFKRNSTQFSKRVGRLIDKGIDHKLRTKEERVTRRRAVRESATQNEAGPSEHRPAEANAVQNGEEGTGAPIQAQKEVPAVPGAGVSSANDKQVEARANGEGQHQSVAEREGAQLTQIASSAVEGGKRPVLVQLDDDEEDADVQTDQAPPALTTVAIDNAQKSAAPLADTLAGLEETAPPSGALQAEALEAQVVAVEIVQETIQIEESVPEMSQAAITQSNGAVSSERAAQDYHTEGKSDLPDYPRQPLPLPPTRTVPSTSTPVRLAEIVTETPRRRSLIQEAIGTSSVKRRRREERRKSRQEDTLDTVQASIVVPPRRVAPPPSPPPQRRTERRNRDRPAEASLTPEEWHSRVLTGEQLVLRKREEYKANITRLCKRFGLGPKDLLQVVNSLPKSGQTGELYWTDIERRLEEVLG